MRKVNRLSTLLLLYYIIAIVLSFLAAYSTTNFYSTIPSPFTSFHVALLGILIIFFYPRVKTNQTMFQIMYIVAIALFSVISSICSIFVAGYLCFLSTALWLAPIVYQLLLIVK